MKKLITVFLIFSTSACLAIVGGGDKQFIIVDKDADGSIQFTTKDNEKSFNSADACARYCYKRSSPENKGWANLVDIIFKTPFSEDDSE